MRASYLLFFLSLAVFGQTKPVIKVLPIVPGPEDYEHMNPGCPENSECDPVMGQQMKKWMDLVKKVSFEESTPQSKSQQIEAFRAQFGIPVEVYTTQKSQQGFKPILFNSTCRDHSSKADQKILKGIAFTKGITQKAGQVWRSSAQIEVPVSELYLPQPVTVFFPEGARTYQLPLGDQPLFVKDKSLHVLKDEEDLFFMLKVSPLGEWSVEATDLSELSQWTDRRTEVACPKSDVKVPPAFGSHFCKSIWDEDAKKPVVVLMHLGCAT
jgi:hypothetical protein